MSKHRLVGFWLFAFLCFAKTGQLSAAQDIAFLTYHNGPPFVVNEAKGLGLSYELAALLSALSNDRYSFKVKVLPRLRLNKILEQAQTCVVPWVQPDWFRNLSQDDFFWTSGILNDGNLVLSHGRKPIEYKGPQSLIGYKLAGLRGGHWVGIDPLIKSLQVTKVETLDYLSAVKLIEAGRVDGALIPLSIAKYLVTENEADQDFYFADNLHSLYQRGFLVCRDRELFEFLQEVSESLKENSRWLVLLKKYHLG